MKRRIESVVLFQLT